MGASQTNLVNRQVMTVTYPNGTVTYTTDQRVSNGPTYNVLNPNVDKV
jgi:hypothetical protein